MKKTVYIVGVAVLALVALKLVVSQSQTHTAISTINKASETVDPSSLKVATFAGGCFWCIESTFEKIPGVVDAVSGYSGGNTEHPTYQQVGKGETGHTEAVQVHYNPDIITYEELLYYFWRDIDPTDSSGQFVDRGSHYRPAIFYHDETEQQLAEESRGQLEQSRRFENPISIEITPFDKFWKAESYHQDYHKKNPFRYKVYREGSGRDRFLKKIWGEDLKKPYPKKQAAVLTSDQTTYKKPGQEALKETLSDIQYEITQNDGTEPPFKNDYWNHKEPGIYVDVVSGEPLFSSTDKFQSGTGWPSFSQPIDKNFIVEATDFKLLFPRTEVRSKYGDSHLGHVFKDGPAPTGLRYCINSAALRFISKTTLKDQGYDEYESLFN